MNISDGDTHTDNISNMLMQRSNMNMDSPSKFLHERHPQYDSQQTPLDQSMIGDFYDPMLLDILSNDLSMQGLFAAIVKLYSQREILQA
jgi:hypothetical protein